MSCIICRRKVDSFKNVLCSICWSKIEFTDKTSSAVVKYNEVVRELIHIFKYRSPSTLCDLFVNWMSLAFDETIRDADIILPVPIHKYKLMTRGYNQICVIAKALANKYKNDCRLNILLKVKNVKSQSTLNRDERKTNVIGSFALNERTKHYLQNKKVLVIDDVVTSGATLLECVKVLNDSKASSVKTLSIAMTDYE
jgi:competence protein ComFC